MPKLRIICNHNFENLIIDGFEQQIIIFCQTEQLKKLIYYFQCNDFFIILEGK